jgi:DNA-cytosine methyltransferase
LKDYRRKEGRKGSEKIRIKQTRLSSYLWENEKLNPDKLGRINVLSLFDGISCGKVAIENLGIEIDNYYTSEIDKYAIAISDYNFKNNIKLGDINNWKNWDINWADIDLVLAGFPCQSWSANGNLLGIEDVKGQLVYPMLKIIDKIRLLNPDVKIILENVKMKSQFQDFLTDLIGVKPILINSSLVSAQNRERLYWSNVSNIEIPQDEGIFFKDIMEISPSVIKGGKLKEYHKNKEGKLTVRGLCHIGTADINGMDSIKRVYHPSGKCPTLQTSTGGNREPKFSIDDTTWRKITPIEAERLQTLNDDYTRYGIINGHRVNISNTQRYQTTGNGWTVKIIQAFLEAWIRECHRT